MNEPRQRAARAIVTGALTLLGLGLGSACEARSSLEAAQTAVAIGQTALPGLQTAIPGVQTALPGIQTILPDIGAQLQAALPGLGVEITTRPSGAANDAVTEVDVVATDSVGTFGQLDDRARRVAALGALSLAGQYYPNATISLTVTDTAGTVLLTGSKAPGQAPSVQ